MRSEIWRQRREQEAYIRSVFLRIDRMIPAGNRIVAAARPRRRGAERKSGTAALIVLRSYEGRNLRELSLHGRKRGGRRRNASPRAGKLRRRFSPRGGTSTAETLAGPMAARCRPSRPRGAGHNDFHRRRGPRPRRRFHPTLLTEILKLMAWTKAKSAAVAGVIVLLAAVNHHRRRQRISGLTASRSLEVPTGRVPIFKYLARPLVRIKPVHLF